MQSNDDDDDDDGATVLHFTWHAMQLGRGCARGIDRSIYIFLFCFNHIMIYVLSFYHALSPHCINHRSKQKAKTKVS